MAYIDTVNSFNPTVYYRMQSSSGNDEPNSATGGASLGASANISNSNHFGVLRAQSGINGFIGNCYYFDGVDDYVVAPSLSYRNAYDWTVSFLIRVIDNVNSGVNGTDGTQVGKQAGYKSAFGVLKNSNYSYSIRMWEENNPSNTHDSTSLNINTTYHIVCTCDNAKNLILYVNGIEKLNFISESSTYGALDILRFGMQNGYPPKNYFGEFFITNQVLTPANVTTLYNSYLSDLTPNNPPVIGTVSITTSPIYKNTSPIQANVDSITDIENDIVNLTWELIKNGTTTLDTINENSIATPITNRSVNFAGSYSFVKSDTLTVKLTVDDLINQVNETSAGIVVSNSIPVLNPISNVLDAKENINKNIQLTFSDADGLADITGLSCTNLPLNWVQTPDIPNQKITLKPAYDAALPANNPYTLTIRVTDSSAAFVEQSFNMTVLNDAPVMPNLNDYSQNIIIGTSDVIVNNQQATDANDHTLIYSISLKEYSPDNINWYPEGDPNYASNPPIITINANTGEVTSSHPNGTTPGWYRVTKRASDG